MKKWFEVFKVGKHTDSAGNTKDWTLADLEKIATDYNSQKDDSKHIAPIVLGHPKDNKPAYGWIEKLKVVGDKLLALPEKVSDEFSNWVKEGKYRTRSISLYGNGLLRHVGFLGAVPPAVKGLADVDLNESEDFISFDFEEENEPNEVEVLESKISEYEEKIKELEQYKNDSETLKEKLEFAEAEKIKAQEELEKLYIRNRVTDFQIYLNDKIAYGNITPAHQQKVMQVLQALDSIQFNEGFEVLEFNEGKEVINKINPVDVFKEFIDSIKLGPAVKEKKEEPIEKDIIKEAVSYMEDYNSKNPNSKINLATAIDRIKN